MRGKLRDKRADVRRDRLKREPMMERRRPSRRENRSVALRLEQLEEDYLLDDGDMFASEKDSKN